MRCVRCGKELGEEEILWKNGVILCEDCYMEEGRVQACNPWAVRFAKIFSRIRQPNLTQRQRQIYEIVTSMRRVRPRELAEKLGISLEEVQNEIAVLRHLELVKSRKEGKEVYVVPFEDQGERGWPKKDLFQLLREKGIEFEALYNSIMRPGAIAARTKRLLAIAAAVGASCDFCVGYHVRLARQEGLSEEEIFEAIMVGAMVRFGSGARYATEVGD